MLPLLALIFALFFAEGIEARWAQICLQHPEISINDPELLCLGVTPTGFDLVQEGEPLRLVPTTTHLSWKRFNIPDVGGGLISLVDSDNNEQLCLERDDNTQHVRLADCELNSNQIWEVENADGSVRAPLGTDSISNCVGVAACMDGMNAEVSPPCLEEATGPVTNDDPSRWAFVKMYECETLQQKLPKNIYKFDLHLESIPPSADTPTQFPTFAPTFDGQVIIVGDGEPTVSPTMAPVPQSPSNPPSTNNNGTETEPPVTVTNRTGTENNSTGDDNVFGGIDDPGMMNSIKYYTWVPVIVLGVTIAVSLYLGPFIVDVTKGSLAPTIRASNAIEAIGIFEVLNIAYFVVIGAQLDLPAIPEHLYMFCLHFSWTTLNIKNPTSSVDVTSTRRLEGGDVAATGGFGRYSDALGHSSESLFEQFLFALLAVLGMCLLSGGVIMVLSQCCSTGTRNEGLEDEPRISRNQRIKNSLKLVTFRIIHCLLYPSILMCFYQFYHVSQRPGTGSLTETTLTVFAGLIITLVAMWLVSVHYKLYKRSLSTAEEKKQTSSDDSCNGFLSVIWKPECSWFWVIQVLFFICRAAIVAVVKLPKPIQPSLLMVTHALYFVALLYWKPYPSTSMNRLAMLMALVYIPASIPLLIFAFDMSSEMGKKYSPTLIQNLGTVQIIIYTILIVLGATFVFLRFAPVLFSAAFRCCRPPKAGKKKLEVDVDEASSAQKPAGHESVSHGQPRRGLQAFSAQGQGYEEFSPTGNQVHGSDEALSFKLTNA